MDAVERAIWADMHEDENGCWIWHGPSGCNIIRLFAKLCECELPSGRKMYRMPECKLGKDCVNPYHVGTSEDWMFRVRTRKMNGENQSR